MATNGGGEGKLIALLKHAKELAQAASTGEIARVTLDTVRTVLGYDLGTLAVVEGGTLRFVASTGFPNFQGITLPLDGPGVTVRAVNTGETQRLDDVSKDPAHLDTIADHTGIRTRSELDVPVKIGGEVVAVINLESVSPAAFTEADATLVEIFGEHVALAIKRLRLLDAEHDNIAKLEALHRHAISLTQAGDLGEICRATLDAVESVMGFHLLSFMVVGEGGLVSIGNRGSPPLGRPLPLDGKGITVKAARERRTIRVNDLRGDPDFVRGTTDSLSELAVPVVIDGETVAVINLESTSLNAFTGQDQNLVEIFSQHIASAIKRMRLIESEEDANADLEALHRHAVRLSSLNDVEEIAAFTMGVIRDVLGHTRGGFAMVGDGRLDFIHTSDVDPAVIPELRLDGRGITVRAVRTGATQFVGDTRLDPDYVPDRGSPSNLSELDVPIKVDGVVVGVITLESRAQNAYTDEDRHIIEILSEHVALAIKRLRLLEKERRNAAKLEALNRSAADLSQSRSVEEAIDAACNILDEEFGYQWVGIGRVDKDAVRYIKYLGADLSGNDTLPLTRRTVTVRAVETGDIQLVRDTSKDPDYIILSPNEKPYLSELVVPVRVKGRIEYVINIESQEIDAFSQEDRRLVELLALHLGSAFELLRERERLAVLHRHAPLIALAKDVAEIAKLALTVTNDVFNFPIASFHVVKGGIVEMVEVTGLQVDSPFTQALDGPGLIPYSLREGRSMLVADVSLDHHYVRGPISPSAERSSELVVPIMLKGVPVAAVNLEAARLGAFNEEDRRLVELLALHVGAALELLEGRRRLREQQAAETRELLEGAHRISSMVRHDLRGPLQTIRNSTYMLREHPERLAELAGAIDDSVAYADRIVEDLGGMTGPSEPQRTLVDLNDLVDASLAQAKVPAGVRVEVTHGEEFIAVSLDATRIRRALDNLVKNAVEAMPEGGTLAIRTAKLPDGVTVEVSDTGVGIPDDVKPLIFRPFHTTKGSGTGLGLTSAKQAVEAHGGSITFESAEGRGTSFTISIPTRP